MEIRRNPYLLFSILLPLSIIPRFLGGDLRRWALWLLLWYVALPLIISISLGFKPTDLGLAMPVDGWRRFSILLGMAVLLSFMGLFSGDMRSYYPRFTYSSWLQFLEKELIMGAIMFAHEVYFRGFLMFPLAEKNSKLAILLQDVPYTLVHIGKPTVEIPYSFVGGIVFGWMDLESRSFLQSFLLHWSGSAFFDLLCALSKAGMLRI